MTGRIATENTEKINKRNPSESSVSSVAKRTRLIERAFPLKQTSLSSVHEKNVRHGHISTLHIWPARRPLAACRAALLATLLPDPGTPEKRRKLCERIGGIVVEKTERKKMPNGRIVERIKEETQGGVLRWIGTEPKSGGRKKIEQHRSAVAFRESELAWFREEIKKAYGGRAPRVLDPFAGGGAIPLEAMRLGCEATAVDINPVAWFILKCTLEYPQKLAGKTHPLPDFVLDDEDFMLEFFTKAKGSTKAEAKNAFLNSGKILKDGKPVQMTFGSDGNDIEADLAWHVRAWGRWVLNHARKELARFYPTYADFEPTDLKYPNAYEKKPMRLVPLNDDGTSNIDALNAEFSKEYLADKRNPRWVAKATVAYLWARTVKCKNCRAIVPLLKTRWLCKKDRKRVLLTMDIATESTEDTENVNEKNSSVSSVPSVAKKVVFGIQNDVPAHGGNAAQKREHDKRIGEGTMSRAGAKCPCCGTIMMMQDIRIEGQSRRIDSFSTAVIVDGQNGKEYRLWTSKEKEASFLASPKIEAAFSNAHHGPIFEPLNPASTRSISCHLYGINNFADFFTYRQHLSLGIFLSAANQCKEALSKNNYDMDFQEAIHAYQAIAIDRLVDYSNSLCSWHVSGEKMRNLLGRFSLPMVWDYCELSPLSDTTGGVSGALEWIFLALQHFLSAERVAPPSIVKNESATKLKSNSLGDQCDLIITDPPYYEAISYADLSELFYIALRRTVNTEPFSHPSIQKDLEAVQHINSTKNRKEEKNRYESLMTEAFQKVWQNLSETGRFVVVFAHKHPDAWETLVSAMIQSGFVVCASWPIQTEMANRTRGLSAAALASSVWLVCKKRPISARPGWDNKVLEDMRTNITERLRDYWDAGIRGPDFVWAATGPALEAYSKHPIVKKANTPGEVMSVGEFLSHVRRMVVDFVVGHVLTGEKEGVDMAAVDRMDAPTAYYLLHRHDFGIDGAPAGACILYATACGLSDRDLESVWDLVLHKGRISKKQDDGEEPDPDVETEPEENGSGSKIKLKTWVQRKRRTMGYEAPSGRPIPLIDRIHRLMHLWRAGDVHKVDEYLDDNGLRRQELFRRLVQSLIELSNGGSEERSLLESLSNHVQAKGATVSDAQLSLFATEGTESSEK